MTASSIRSPAGQWPVAAFLLLAAGIGGLWFSAISAYEAAVLRERGRELQAIAELKIDFVRLWLDERRGDAGVQAGRLTMARALVPRAGHPAADSLEDVQGQLEVIRKAYQYKAVTLIDLGGAIRHGAGPLSEFGRRATIAAAQAAMAAKQFQVVRTYHAEEGGRHHIDIDIAAPVADSRQPGAPIVGALAFHLDSRLHLDPLLRRWPAPGGSGESFLFERDGEELVYLTSLRHGDAEALRKRTDESSLPAAMAAKGSHGVVEGFDYRGTPVLAAVGQVPDMPWYVVAKLDRDEILAPVRREALWSGMLTAALVLALGLAAFAWRRRGEAAVALAREVAEKAALAAGEARFRKLHEHGWDFNALFDRNMIIRYASPSIDRYLGYKATGEGIGVGAARAHPDDVARIEAARKAALARPGVPQYFEHRLMKGDGEWLAVEACFTSHLDDPDIAAFAYTARDISGRIEAERLLRESEERYRHLFQLSPDAVFVHRDDRILIANAAAARLFRADSAEALIGRAWRDLAPAESGPKIAARIASLRSGVTAFLPPAELGYRTLDGETIDVEATAACIPLDGGTAILSVVRDLSERKQAEAQRLQQCREQRDTLVREVHHRIKNHLQGLAGLLNQHRRQYPALHVALDTVIDQIAAISVIHGLQGRAATGEVRLHGLLSEIVAFLRVHAALIFADADNPRCRDCRWRVADEESVPLALILNELMTNAIRHGDPAPAGQPPQVGIACACDDRHVVVRISNTGTLPAGFDFTRGRGLGTGLALVRSLLPQTGAGISIAATEGRVVASVELAPPVLSMPAVAGTRT